MMKFKKYIVLISGIFFMGLGGLNAQSVWMLNVIVSGSGAGTVEGGAIDCGNLCDDTAFDGEEILLTALPDEGSVFGGWLGDCSGVNPTCPLTMDKDKTVTAVFNNQEKNESNNDDSSFFDDWFNGGTVFNFIKKITKKPKKQWLGYSPLPKPLFVFRKKFDPSSLGGAKWKINMNNLGEPIAQGSLVKKGLYMNIAVGLYTGMVRGMVRGKESWNVLYENRQDANIAELFWKGGGYQREAVADQEGNLYTTALLAEGKTLFAATPEGVVFVVSPGVFPEPLRVNAVRVVVPRGGPFIPVDDLLRMFFKQVVGMFINIFSSPSFAAVKSLGEQIADYKKILGEMDALWQSYRQINFDDPDTDFDFAFDFVQNFYDRFETVGKSLNAVAAAMGHNRMFVRDYDWFAADNAVIGALVGKGVAPTIAALIAQGAPPFDFYAVQGDAQKKVIAGSCGIKRDREGNQGMACAVRTISAVNAQLALTRADASYDALVWADGKLREIEEAFFGSPEAVAEE